MRKTRLSKIQFKQTTINRGIIKALQGYSIYDNDTWTYVTDIQQIHKPEVAIQLIAALENKEVLYNLCWFGIPAYYLIRHLFIGLSKIEHIKVDGNDIEITVNGTTKKLIILDRPLIQHVIPVDRVGYIVLIVPQKD